MTTENANLDNSLQRLDNSHRAIIDFIKIHPGVTENKVVQEMHKRKICSKITTLKKIRELLDMGEIIDSLKKGESGFHRLIVNDSNEFNAIDNELSQIETIIDNKNEYRTDTDSYTEKSETKNGSSRSDTIIEYQLVIITSMLLFRSLIRVNNIIKSEKDSQLLLTKIIRVMQKMANLSSQTLLWNLLEVDLIDLKMTADAGQLMEWWNSRTSDVSMKKDGKL